MTFDSDTADAKVYADFPDSHDALDAYKAEVLKPYKFSLLALTGFLGLPLRIVQTIFKAHAAGRTDLSIGMEVNYSERHIRRIRKKGREFAKQRRKT
jgi:hypothetical protein